MDLVREGDTRYDELRALFNAMIDKRPAVLAQCAAPADVRSALERMHQNKRRVNEKHQHPELPEMPA